MKREEYQTGDLVRFTQNGKTVDDFICKVDGVIHLYNKGKFNVARNWEKQVEYVGHDASLEIHEYEHVSTKQFSGFKRIK